MDRDNEVNRILGAFKLNPMEQLGLKFDASEEDIKRQYRKTSLLVHPDKCKHPQAQTAFEVLGHANKQMQDPDKLKELMYVLSLARGTPMGSVAGPSLALATLARDPGGLHWDCWTKSMVCTKHAAVCGPSCHSGTEHRRRC